MNTKKKYLVSIPEVHYSIREVWADTEEEAKEEALDADEISCEYSHTLDDPFTHGSKITVEEITTPSCPMCLAPLTSKGNCPNYFNRCGWVNPSKSSEIKTPSSS